MSRGDDIRDGVKRVPGLDVHRPDAAARDADAELDAMVTEHVAHLMARGLDAEAARAEARRHLGVRPEDSRDDVRRSAHDRERRLRVLDLFAEARSDARLAFRALRRAPAFAGAAILTLALAIGANTAIFSAVRAVVLRPLPFAQPDRLVAFWETNPDFHWTRAEAAPSNYLDWKEQVAAFDDIAAYFDFGTSFTLTGYGEPRLLATRSVTGNLFRVLGVPAMLGGTLDSTDTWNTDGAAGRVVLTYATWKNIFGGDSSIVGRSIDLSGRRVTVAGVLPASFMMPGVTADIFRSIGWSPGDRGQAYFRRAHYIRPVGRLKPGVSLAEANAQLQAVVTRLQREYPGTNKVMGAGIGPLHAFLVGDTSRVLYVMLSAVGVLLLIACANVANLLLVRAAGRQREVAMRMALGAGRGRLARHALTESLVLALAGGIGGLGLGWVGTRAFVALQPAGMLPVQDLAMDGMVLSYVMAATLLSAVVFGVAPAVWAARRAPADVLKDEGRGASSSRRTRRLGELLLVGQVALALTLAVGAGLIVRSYAGLSKADLGFTPKGVLAVTVNLPRVRYDSLAKLTGFFATLEREASGLPGVTGAASVSTLPLTGPSWSSQFSVEGRPPVPSTRQVRHRDITPAYERVMGEPLKAGRFLRVSDDQRAANVVLVNDAFVREFFPSGNPVGLRISFDRIPDSTSTWRTIVGVVGDERVGAIADVPEPEILAPFAQENTSLMSLVVRTTGDPAALAPAVRRIIAALDPALAISSIRTMDEVRSGALARDRFLTILMLSFALVGMALGVVGVYGVVAQLVRRRMREMGIRMALGAAADQVQWLVVRHGVVLAAAGIGVGVAASIGLTRLFGSLLYGVAPTDVATFMSVSALLLLAALAASWVPARQASRTAPTEVLRAD